MKRRFDLDAWPRKAHFEYFNKFEEPYYGVCVRVDCTAAYAMAKRRGFPFFLYYLYQSVAAANTVQPFRLRIEGEDVFLYDTVDAGSTIARDDGTFGFGYFKYSEDIEQFMAEGLREVARVRATTGLERRNLQGMIRYSPVPWLDFTSLSHPRRFSAGDSCPWITFGKMTEIAGRRSMPMSVHVHHALVDGADIGAYVDEFQRRMNME